MNPYQAVSEEDRNWCGKYYVIEKKCRFHVSFITISVTFFMHSKNAVNFK
jgi:hypothetical protein